MKLAKLWVTVALVMALVGCAGSRQIPDYPPVPNGASLISPPPEPEPVVWPVLETAGLVTANGKPLPDGYVLLDGRACINLSQLAEALGGQWQFGSGRGSLIWNDRVFVMEADSHWVTRYPSEERKILPAPVVAYGENWYAPVEIAEAMGFGFLEDRSENHLYITPEAGKLEVPAGYDVPVLMYHAVEDETWGFEELFVRPADLEAQLQLLTDGGYTPVFFSDLAQVDEIEKPVILTFDDGYVDNYTQVFPLLQKYGVKATIFLITGNMDVNSNYMTWAQVEEMAASGLVSFQSHTVTHPQLHSLSYEEQEAEMVQCKLDIVRHTGREPYVLSYPEGLYNGDTKTLTELHYRFGLIMGSGTYNTDRDPLKVNRWYVARSTGLGTYEDMVE